MSITPISARARRHVNKRRNVNVDTELGNARASSNERHLSDRRAVVRGVLWGAPAIAAAVAVPAASASAVEPTPGSVSFAVPSLDTSAAGQHTWTVPPSITEVTFTVLGGVGAAGAGPIGGLVPDPLSPTGGVGAVVTGTVAVTPGEQLTLIVGQGGSTYAIDPAHTGGQGYGNGGDATLTNAPYRFSHGGGGGGASAILRAGNPLVVAGGGGGGGARGYRNQHLTLQVGSDGGPADGASRRGSVTQIATATETSARMTAVDAVIGSAGGTSSGNRHGWVDGKTASDRNGADAVSFNMPSHTIPDVSVISGAGGGGYAGGGSGSVAYYYHVPAGQPDYYEHAFISAGGAGGTSYIASGVTATTTLRTDVTWSPRDLRRPGAITLTWRP